MMTMIELITVLSFGLTCFSVGYAIGRRDNKKTQKQPPNTFAKIDGY